MKKNIAPEMSIPTSNIPIAIPATAPPPSPFLPRLSFVVPVVVGAAGCPIAGVGTELLPCCGVIDVMPGVGLGGGTARLGVDDGIVGLTADGTIVAGSTDREEEELDILKVRDFGTQMPTF
jgi:hypothetical protein